MKTEKYNEQQLRLPVNGKQVIGRMGNENIVVYQAFNLNIASYAVQHQKFGGDSYSFNRMSWIKPGFLWMMHRAGWAQKENQERILAITLPIVHFKTILSEATITSYEAELYASHDSWKRELDQTEVRLQWDPDHDPFGNKLERKAIQIGMKGAILKRFCTEWITGVEDVTEFVKNEHQKLTNNRIEDLLVPFEDIIELNDSEIEKRIGISN